MCEHGNGTFHYQIRSGEGLGGFCSCATLHAAWREDCMIPLPESRLVCIPSLVLQKIKDVIPYDLLYLWLITGRTFTTRCLQTYLFCRI